MESKELDEKFTQTEMGELKNALAKKEQEDRIKDDRIKQLERSIDVIQKNFPAISRIVEVNLPVAEVQASLRKREVTRK